MKSRCPVPSNLSFIMKYDRVLENHRWQVLNFNRALFSQCIKEHDVQIHITATWIPILLWAFSDLLEWSVAKFLVPYWRDKVDYGMGLLNWPASLCSLTGWYDNPMPELTLSPQSGLWIGPLMLSELPPPPSLLLTGRIFGYIARKSVNKMSRRFPLLKK